MSSHFIELKYRLILCILFFCAIFFILFLFYDKLYDFVSTPLLKQMPQGSNIITTKIITPFTIPLKLCYYLAIFFSIPFIFYHVWAFILPGLYSKEKKFIFPISLCSIIFFYIGIFFSFYIICPVSINFFSSSTPKSVLFMVDIEHYLTFIFTICLLTGLVFQIPVILKILIKLQITQKKTLQQKRKFIIVLAFVLGMLLTPPDVLSQIILAIPIIGLFEIGLLIS
mgnify:CR=1 FL=1